MALTGYGLIKRVENNANLAKSFVKQMEEFIAGPQSCEIRMAYLLFLMRYTQYNYLLDFVLISTGFL